MDMLTGGVVVGAAFLIARRETALPPADSQPENKGPVIPSKKDPLPAKQVAGGFGGAALGAALGKGVADVYLQLTAGYNAPNTKAIAVPTLIGLTSVGGALVVVVGLTYGAMAAGYVGVIVIAVVALVFSAFIIAANVEDVDRWNAYVFHKRMIVKLVSEGNFKTALIQANEGAKRGIPGLGFYLSPNHTTVYYHGTLYNKEAFDASPKIPVPGGHGGLVGRGGLDHDYYYPEVIPYNYATYFGKDGAQMFTRADGTQVNLQDWMTALYTMQWNVYDRLTQHLKRAPTWEEWLSAADLFKDQNGVTLREYIALHDAVGAKVQPAVPWLDVYLLQSPEFSFYNEQTKVTSKRIIHKRTYATNEGLSNISAGLSLGNF